MATPFPQCRVGRGGIMIDNALVPPLAYTSYLPRAACYREIADCGMHLYCFPAYLAGRGINIHSGIGPFRKGVWLGTGEYDFSDITADMDLLIGADPQAKVIMRLHLDVPEWWERAYPEGCCLTENGTPLRQSFTSPVWRESAETALRDIIAWFAASPYARHLVGVHVAAGGTEEWVYHYFSRFTDANPSRLEAFQDFLKERCPSAEARAAAWAASSLKDEVAALDVLGREPETRWRDPVTDAAALDACHFHSGALVDAMSGFCRAVKDAGEGHLLAGVFYGYHFYIGDARKGHTALSRLLACRDVDYIASPNMYWREPGIDWPPMAAVDSVRLHGKLWMAENDTRTALTRPLAEAAPAICPPGQYRDGVWKGPESMELSRQLLRANTGRMLTHGYGGWWFDMWGGWFSHPDLLAEIAAGLRLWEPDTSDPRAVPEDCVCVLVDERLTEYDASFGALSQGVFANRNVLFRCGRPWRMFLRNDLPLLDLSHARCVWMLGVPTLSAEESALLAAPIAAAAAVLHTGFEETRRLDSRGQTEMPRGVTLTAPELRGMLDEVGMHSYLHTEDVFHVGHGFLSIHAATAGEKRLALPRPMRVTQVLPCICEQGVTTELRLDLAVFETRIFRLENTA